MKRGCYIFSIGIVKIPKMDATSKLPIQYYEKVGELLYAISAIDKVVRKEEFRSLKNSLNSFWTSFKVNGQNASLEPAAVMETAFMNALRNKKDPETCYAGFVKYKKNNPEQFNTAHNKVIWDTVNLIANSYSLVNKSEVIFLQKLKLVLQDS